MTSARSRFCGISRGGWDIRGEPACATQRAKPAPPRRSTPPPPRVAGSPDRGWAQLGRLGRRSADNATLAAPERVWAPLAPLRDMACPTCYTSTCRAQRPRVRPARNSEAPQREQRPAALACCVFVAVLQQAAPRVRRDCARESVCDANIVRGVHFAVRAGGAHHELIGVAAHAEAIAPSVVFSHVAAQ